MKRKSESLQKKLKKIVETPKPVPRTPNNKIDALFKNIEAPPELRKKNHLS